MTDCIVDGDVSGRDVQVDASTIFGTTQAQTLHASNSILLGKVTVERRQEGCVRFSYLPFDSESPRRYRCQPEDATQAARVRPRFESVSFGEPAYAQLHRRLRAGDRRPAPTTREKWARGISCRRRCACATCAWRSTSICDSGWRRACSSCRNNRNARPTLLQGITSERDIAAPRTRAKAPPRSASSPRHDESEDCHRAEEADCAHIAENQMKGDFSRSTFRVDESLQPGPRPAGARRARRRAERAGRHHRPRRAEATTDISRRERCAVPSGDRVPEFPGQGRSGRQGSADRARPLLRRRHPV